MAEDDSTVGRSLIKHLACSNKSTREKALRLILQSWLPSRSQPLSDDDAKKLWKGLFYCVWHSDKPIVQSALINRLANLLLTFHHLPLSLQYLSTFFLTIRREWSGIDALRLDKFYLLTRRFISHSFSLLKKYSWDSELVNRVMVLFDEATLCSHDKFRGGNGVNYHCAAVFLEELKPFLPVKQEILEVLFKPFISAMGKLPDKVLLGKIRSGMFDVLLLNGKRLLEVKKAGGYDEKVGSDDDDDDGVVVLGTIAVVMGFSGRFYELGSAPECVQGNRKVLFELHREFSKLEKDAAASGFEFSIPDRVEEEEEVPNLVPIANGSVEGDALPLVDLGLAAKVLKKCKKEKKKSGDGKKKAKKNKKSGASALSPAENDNENAASEDGGSSNEERVNDENTIPFNEAAISNLQKQFEKIAAEAGLDDGVALVCDIPEAGIVTKKRKRSKSAKGKASQDSDLNGAGDEEAVAAKSGEKSAKKVRFSMKNNLIWKPQSPLPPLDVRIPPSVTPRGSALKKGVPPGPVREMSSSTKKKLKKGRKKVVASSVKRLKKLKSRS